MTAALPREQAQSWPALPTPLRRVGKVAFALIVCAAIFGSFQEIGFDPGFPRYGDLRDFGSFYESGRAGARGDDPYGVYPLTFLAAAGPAGAARNLNAPFSVLVFEPLGLLQPTAAAKLWNIAAALAYAAAVLLVHAAYPATRAPWRLFWAFGISSLWGTLGLGQIYTFLALATTGAWLLVARGRDREAGVLIGAVVAIKPNFLVWPVLLFIAGQRRAALSALAASAVFGALPMVQLGPRVYVQWLAALRETTPDPSATNGALSGLVARLGLPVWVGLVAAAVLLVCLAHWAWRTRPAAIHVSAVALTATLLASPLAWTGYAVLLVPIFFARAWTALLGVAAAILLVPVFTVLVPLSTSSGLLTVIVGSAYTWAWLLILGSLLQVFGAERVPRAQAA